jgi:hypothetical protein
MGKPDGLSGNLGSVVGQITKHPMGVGNSASQGPFACGRGGPQRVVRRFGSGAASTVRPCRASQGKPHVVIVRHRDPASPRQKLAIDSARAPNAWKTFSSIIATVPWP